MRAWILNAIRLKLTDEPKTLGGRVGEIGIDER